MYAHEFRYLTPRSEDEAISLLDEHGDAAKVLAGGQSLIPMMTLRLVEPTVLVDINRLPIDGLRADGGTLTIQAGVRHRQLVDDPLVRQHAPVVQEAARFIGNVRVRTLGTIGGSVAHADPAAELPCVLTALGAEIVVVGKGGKRVIDAEKFFISHFTTVLESTELIKEIRIPWTRPRSGQAFVEFSRRAGGSAVVEAAAVVGLDRRDRYQTVSLVLGGIEAAPLQLGPAVEALLVGRRPSSVAIAEAIRVVRSRLDPRDDVERASSYRSRLAETFAHRALVGATKRAPGGQRWT